MSIAGTGHRVMHAKLKVDEELGARLLSPAVGQLRCVLGRRALVQPGTRLGWLEILGRTYEVLAPQGAYGRVNSEESDLEQAHRPVAFGDVLIRLEAIEGGEESLASDASTTAETGARVVRAPSSGRFYAKPAPDEPQFVKQGDELEPGTTLCLLEVMKTFNRVSFSAEDHAGRVRITACLVEDGEDVDKGQALFAFEPA